MPMASLLASSSSPLLSFLLPSPSRSLTLPSTPTRLRPRLRGPLRPPRATNPDPSGWREEGDRPLRRALDSLSALRNALPPQVKAFPWSAASARFLGIVLDLALAVARFLCVPVLAVSSLSEMSYCAHERRLGVVPLPFLAGVAVALAALRAATDLAPELEEGGVPWHLVAMGVLFALLKLPGPYYPYWIRVIVPHFANGGLWTTLWFTFRRRAMGRPKVERSGA